MLTLQAVKAAIQAHPEASIGLLSVGFVLVLKLAQAICRSFSRSNHRKKDPRRAAIYNPREFRRPRIPD